MASCERPVKPAHRGTGYPVVALPDMPFQSGQGTLVRANRVLRIRLRKTGIEIFILRH